MATSSTCVPAYDGNNEINLSAKNLRPLLSIIIPAYNEERRLPESLDKIMTWIETASCAVEVLVVENGSQDRTTDIAQSYANCFANLCVLHSAKGKGAAVREGILHGRGDYLFICDSDLSMPITEVEKFLSPHLVGYDIVIASREAAGAVRYGEPYFRHFMGRVFNSIVRVLAVPGFQDTQCGFKLFKREAALELFSLQISSGWAFDVEILYLALKYGYRIAEVPINWYYNADSRVNPLGDTWRMFRDVIKIRLNDLRGVYDRLSPTVPTVEQSGYGL